MECFRRACHATSPQLAAHIPSSLSGLQIIPCLVQHRKQLSPGCRKEAVRVDITRVSNHCFSSIFMNALCANLCSMSCCVILTLAPHEFAYAVGFVPLAYP